MHDLTPLTALGGTTAYRRVIGAIELVEVPDLALASVAGRLGSEPECAIRLGDILGESAPDVGKAVTGAEFSAFWAGPAQWFVSAHMDTHEDLAQHLKEHLGTSASVTEQNDGWVCVDVIGDTSVDLFERLCPVPARRMRSGDAQRTTIHHLGCFVLCTQTSQRFRVLGPRSSARSLMHALCTVAKAL